MFLSIFNSYKLALSNASFRNRFLMTLPFFIAIIASLPFCFTYYENRSGAVLADPFLALFAPRDVSLFTFTVTYFAGFLGFFHVFSKAHSALRGMQAYVFMMSMRLTCLYLLPLDPPAHIIPLHDVILESIFYSGQSYLKDLFFSGHTATIFLFALASREKPWRAYLFISAGLIGAGVLIQHVHYTVDVFAAPVFSWMAWRMSRVTSLVK